MNKETIEALRQVDEDIELIEHETLEEFWAVLELEYKKVGK